MSEVYEEYAKGEQFARLSVFASLKKKKKKTKHKKKKTNLGKMSLIKLWLF